MARVLFLTGHLAEARLRRTLEEAAPPDVAWTVRDAGVQVAALLTADILRRRIPRADVASRFDRAVVPGHCRGDLDALSEAWGVSVERGPEDLHDLPEWLGGRAAPVDLAQHAVRIFAEIVDAPRLGVEAIVARAARLVAEGADVVDLGCLPGTPFPQMEEAIAALGAAGVACSVDSADLGELRRGACAGAGFLLSLTEATLDLAEETEAVPVLIPARPGDLDGLLRAADRMARLGRPCILDPILDPIPFGLAASVERYAALRRARPEARIMMGVGNVTELTDADTTGVNAVLFGLCAELGVTDALCVQVSPHCRRAVREADRARRLMHAAARLGRTPTRLDDSLLALRDRRPHAASAAQIAETAAMVRDANFRIEVAEDGIHVYSRAGHHVAETAFDLFPRLGVEADGAHAFYLGVELARAEIAYKLGKRYVQDEDLGWGCAVDARAPADPMTHTAPGPTLQAAGRRHVRRAPEEAA